MTARDPLPFLQPGATRREAASEPAQAGAPAGSALLRWPDSLRHSVLLVLLAVLTVGAASALSTRYLLGFRIHDYAILHLAGQLRELAHGMALDGQVLMSERDTAPPVEELRRYAGKLQTQVAQYDRIVESFFARNLPPDLTGLDQPVSCNWDAPSLHQLKLVHSQWRDVRTQLSPALAASADPHALLAAATVLDREGPKLLGASRELAGAFKTMMQLKLDQAIRLQAWSLALTAVLTLLLWYWVRRKVVRPLQTVEQGAREVLDGALGQQTPVEGGAETRAVASALNGLSQRMHILFELSARSGAGLSTHDVLDAVLAALQPVVPLQGVVLVRRAGTEGQRRWLAMRRAWAASPAGVGTAAGPVPTPWPLEGAELSRADTASGAQADIDLLARQDALRTAFSCTLRDDVAEGWLLCFILPATSVKAHQPVQALLATAARLVGAQVDRTLSSDALVVACVEGLAKLAESRDPETGDHLLRMSRYSALIAQAMMAEPRYAKLIDAAFVEDLERFAPMHDIGKVGIADSILLKPGRLSDEERADMSRHPLIGADVLRRCEAQMKARGRSVFRLGIEIAESHHERWDGKGYPHGQKGQDIPLAARIVALADVFDALTSRRPYKEAWSVERALETIRSDSGQHFDPDVVSALERAMPQVLAFYEQHKHV